MSNTVCLEVSDPGPWKGQSVVTISDVARQAGVSTATVSRALNNVGTVDPELAARAREAARLLRYRPNGVARNLRRRRTDVWALIISDIENPFFTSVARGVEDVAQEAGFSLVLCNSDEDPAKERRYLDVAEGEQVSGVVLSPNMVGSDVSALLAADIPVVTVDRPLRQQVDSVLVDSRAGAGIANAHLVEQGWARVACITGPARADTAQERLRGYRDAMRAAGRPIRGLVRHADYKVAGGRRAAASLLSAGAPPDGFFVANNQLALGLLQELADRGIRPGRDVGVIAFDDAPWASLTTPPLSVVAQPAYDVGAAAARLLLDRVRRESPERPRTVTLPVTLLLRASSQRPNRRRREVPDGRNSGSQQGT